MRFDCDLTGAWFVDPDDLAQRLGIAPSYLRSQMRQGLVTSRVVPGSGEDEGRSQVTIRAGGHSWQGTFDDSGALLSERALQTS